MATRDSTGPPDHHLMTQDCLSPAFGPPEQHSMFQFEVAVSVPQACAAIVTSAVGRPLRVGVMLLGVVVLMAVAGVSGASASHAQQSLPAEPLVVVESFLSARNARDPFSATGWCAALLELQDIDGQWFVDEPSTRYWLRQLTDKYLIDTLSPPLVNGITVKWTERLTPRTVVPSDPWSKIMTVEVSAVIRGGMIAYLSAPYPPLPLRPLPGAATVEPSDDRGSGNTPTVAPATLFLGHPWSGIDGASRRTRRPVGLCALATAPALRLTHTPAQSARPGVGHQELVWSRDMTHAANTASYAHIKTRWPASAITDPASGQPTTVAVRREASPV
jgi:hypothetical protein